MVSTKLFVSDNPFSTSLETLAASTMFDVSSKYHCDFIVHQFSSNRQSKEEPIVSTFKNAQREQI